jgi:MFS family permease
MGHTSMTSMARYFDKERGRAASIALLGLPAGQALLSPAAVYLKDAIGWRMTWVACGGLLAVVLIPLVIRLLHRHEERHEAWLERINHAAKSGDPEGRSWTRREVLRDLKFYLLIPASVSCAFLLTGIFFHQVHLVESKGWSLQWYALCFSGFSASQAFSTLAAGPLVDRFGARRVVLVMLWPFALGLAALATMQAPITALIFLLLAGLSAGSSATLGSALWAELYGTRYLGAIRALLIAVFVGATAVAPALMGAMIDRGVTMEAIAWMSAGWLVVSTGLAAVGIAAGSGAER